MKIVRYENVPKKCNEILENVEKSGVSFEVHKDGRPYVRIEPVDEVTKAQFAAKARFTDL